MRSVVDIYFAKDDRTRLGKHGFSWIVFFGLIEFAKRSQFVTTVQTDGAEHQERTQRIDTGRQGNATLMTGR